MIASVVVEVEVPLADEYFSFTLFCMQFWQFWQFWHSVDFQLFRIEMGPSKSTLGGEIHEMSIFAEIHSKDSLHYSDCK